MKEMTYGEVQNRLELTPEQRLDALREHLDRIELPENGKDYVLEVASSPPSRRVGVHRNRNLVCDVPIPHLGVVLQAESGSGEYFFLLETSRRRDVIAIFDQPTGVPLTITTKRGVKTPITYTPDFLVVFEDRVEVCEIKADTSLESNCREKNTDWQRTSKGFAYLPAQRLFRTLGIEHVTIPNSTTSSVRADNLRLLFSVRDVEDTPRLSRLRNRIMSVVGDVDAIQIGDLLCKIGVEDTTAVLQLIDTGDIYADLDSVLLASPSRVWISRHPEMPAFMVQSAPRIENALADCGRVATSEVACPKYLREVLCRHIACGLSSAAPPSNMKVKSARSGRRYRKTYRQSGNDIRSLIPRWGSSGNRTPRRSQAHQTLIDDAIAEAKSDPNRSTPANAYHAYISKFNGSSLSQERSVTKCTFRRAYKSHATRGDYAMARGGRRESNALAVSLDPLCRVFLSTRAFALAHIDHYNVDLELVVGRLSGKKITKRAWLTAMVDAYSGEVLALWLSFRSPCRQSCAMVIRDCVRRHKRLPEIIVVDGAPEFDSVHFTTMLATLGVTRINRPPEDPRFGEEVERLFGAFKEKFARGLPGFIPGIQFSRKTSGKFSAAQRAELRLHQLFDALEAYVFRGYNHEPKPQTLESRLALRAMSDARFPFSGKHIQCDTSFLIQTAVEAPRPCYEIAPGRGIRVYEVWYNCGALADYQGPKKNVFVRIEPFNKSVVYVCLEDWWHVCRSTDAVLCGFLPELEVMGRTAEHQQLGGLRERMALEEEHRAYEKKMSSLQSVREECLETRALDEVRAHDDPKDASPARTTRDYSEVRELSMEGESS